MSTHTRKCKQRRKTHAPMAFGSRIFSPEQLKISTSTPKTCWHFTCHSLSLHIFGGKRQSQRPCWPIKNQLHVSFAQRSCETLVIMFCDFLKKKHTLPVQSTQQLIFSLDWNLAMEKISLKFRKDIQLKPIEVTTSSSVVVEEEQFLFTKLDSEDGTEEQAPRTERSILEGCNRMGYNWGTILDEAKYQGIYKEIRKHYVIFHQQNQDECTNTSGTSRRYITQEFKAEKTWPSTWWAATNTR